MYGEDAVERLAFIPSAKMLGLALEEIREEAVCAPVRARMVPLVADRITETDGRIAELRAVSAHLAGVHADRSGPAPAGACGPDCGCTTTSPAPVGPVPITLPPTRPRPAATEAWRDALVACTLGGAEPGERTEQWQHMVDKAETRQEIPDGVRLSFPADAGLAGEIAALAAEHGCCSAIPPSHTDRPTR